LRFQPEVGTRFADVAGVVLGEDVGCQGFLTLLSSTAGSGRRLFGGCGLPSFAWVPGFCRGFALWALCRISYGLVRVP
jgi:hypothetical protein